MIQDPSKDLTLIIYNTPKPPQYIKINKILVRVLLFLIPILVIGSIMFSMISSVYMKKKLERAKSHEPQVITNLKTENAQLQAEVLGLESAKRKLEKKISAGVQDTSIAGILGFFNIPLGLNDLRDKKHAKMENISSQSQKDKLIFKFDLLNNGVIRKLSGYITVMQFHSNGISHYPQYDLPLEAPKLNFSKGESFTVSRFRPVIAEFAKPKGTSVWYQVFIFSRSGDLISFKKAGPYPID